MRSKVVLLNIKQKYANEIYSNEKIYEYRKSFPKDVEYIILYEVEKRSITGLFIPGKIYRKSIDVLWELTKDHNSHYNRFLKYYEKQKTGVAIEIREFEKFDREISLNEFKEKCKRLKIMPSYTIIDEDSDLFPRLLGLSNLLRNRKRNLQTELQLLDNIIFEDFIEEDKEDFIIQVTKRIGSEYDEITPDFAKHIIKCHEKGFDPYGYFTLRKKINVIYIGKKKAGYMVTTEKRGGSVKFGPTIIYENFQRSGVALRARLKLDQIYAENGFRKGYSTIPDKHISAYKYLLKTGYKIEAHLSTQYRKTNNELVFGKLYSRPEISSIPSISRWKDQEIHVINGIPNKKSFKKYLIRNMEPWYNDIDLTFVNQVIEAQKRYEEKYYRKGKKVFTVVNKNQHLRGVAICTPKRGGSVKIAPVILTGDPSLCDCLLKEIESFFIREGKRKLYALIPCIDILLDQLFYNNGYNIEGILREPYKENINIHVFYKIIGDVN